MLLPVMWFALGALIFVMLPFVCGFVRLMIRDFAHLLDTAALFIGWLWPLWDSRNRTFADLLLRTEVHRVDRPARDMRRFAAKVSSVSTRKPRFLAHASAAAKSARPTPCPSASAATARAEI